MSATPAEASVAGACRLLEVLPELEDSLPVAARRLAREVGVARAVRLAPGSYARLPTDVELHRGLGLLVLSGLLCRHVEIAGRVTAELLGRGDLLNPAFATPPPDDALGATVTWRVLQPTRVALLDREFVRGVAPCPDLVCQIAGATQRRVQAVALRMAIERCVVVEERLVLLLWHLAERWGKVTPAGVAVSLPGVSHALLGQLVGVRRPSVTTGLGRLRAGGVLVASASGRWVLAGEQPSPLSTHDVLARARAARRVAAERVEEAEAVKRQSRQAQRHAQRQRG
jgi:CRP-like cAMP-binding protein